MLESAFDATANPLSNVSTTVYESLFHTPRLLSGLITFRLIRGPFYNSVGLECLFVVRSE